MKNPCIRCGKERVDGEVWTEMVGQVLVTHVQTICPDPACQKIVDEQMAAKKEKKELIMNARKTRSEQFRAKLSTRKIRPAKLG